MIKKRILILFAHPAFHKSRVNKKMINEINEIEGITFINLYEEYPDFQIDISKEQDLLLNHDIIIWHHPFYWYSAPAILKEWIDLVLQHGFAYGRMGTALKNKQVLSVITTGGRREAYQTEGFNQYTMQGRYQGCQRACKETTEYFVKRWRLYLLARSYNIKRCVLGKHGSVV